MNKKEKAGRIDMELYAQKRKTTCLFIDRRAQGNECRTSPTSYVISSCSRAAGMQGVTPSNSNAGFEMRILINSPIRQHLLSVLFNIDVVYNSR